jgi:hypothetical protein
MRLKALAFALLAAACSNDRGEAPEGVSAAQDAKTEAVARPSAAAARPRLQPLWTAQGFDAPEGVAPAPDGGYFISNVGGDGETKDGSGWISKLSVDGAVMSPRFIDGLDGPKGMAVLDGKLYVADIDQVRIFDAASGAPAEVIAIAGAEFLNDATAWNGEVFVSDSATARIWRMAPEGPVIWREGEDLKGVNGLLGIGDRMLISTMTSGSLYEATTGGGWREIATGMIDADGIGIVPERAGGGYLISSWPGEIHHVAADGTVASLLNTREAEILQNDLTIFDDIVIVPNWMPGTVTAWRVAG